MSGHHHHHTYQELCQKYQKVKKEKAEAEDREAKEIKEKQTALQQKQAAEARTVEAERQIQGLQNRITEIEKRTRAAEKQAADAKQKEEKANQLITELRDSKGNTEIQVAIARSEKEEAETKATAERQVLERQVQALQRVGQTAEEKATQEKQALQRQVDTLQREAKAAEEKAAREKQVLEREVQKLQQAVKVAEEKATQGKQALQRQVDMLQREAKASEEKVAQDRQALARQVTQTPPALSLPPRNFPISSPSTGEWIDRKENVRIPVTRIILENKIEDRKKLGEGGQGRVFLGSYKKGKENLRDSAIKVFKAHGNLNKERVRQEAAMAKRYSDNEYLVGVSGICFPALVELKNMNAAELSAHLDHKQKEAGVATFIVNRAIADAEWQLVNLGSEGQVVSVPLADHTNWRVRKCYRKYLADKVWTELSTQERAMITSYFCRALGYIAYDSTPDAEQYYLVMEHFPKGSLAQCLQHPERKPKGDQQPLNLVDQYQLSFDIIKGLMVLHGTDREEKDVILHRDLKSGNVLLYRYEGRLRAKLADFGLASLQEQVRKSKSGTPSSRAPELKDGMQKPTKASDIYSLGILLWELWSAGQKPNQLTAAAIAKLEPKEIGRLIENCTQIDPQKRPILSDIEKRFSSCVSAIRPPIELFNNDTEEHSYPDSPRAVDSAEDAFVKIAHTESSEEEGYSSTEEVKQRSAPVINQQAFLAASLVPKRAVIVAQNSSSDHNTPKPIETPAAQSLTSSRREKKPILFQLPPPLDQSRVPPKQNSSSSSNDFS